MSLKTKLNISDWLTAFLALFILILSPLNIARASEGAVQEFHRAAYSGDFSTGITKLKTIVDHDRKDTEAIFALGVLQVFDALTNFYRTTYEHTGEFVPTRVPWNILRLGGIRTPKTKHQSTEKHWWAGPPNAKPMTYEILRKQLAQFYNKLAAAEATLALVGERPVKLPLQFAKVSFDLDRDGHSTSLRKTLETYRRKNNKYSKLGPYDKKFVFDTADAVWLRGYCNLFLAVSNLYLAVDFENSYNATAHLAYGAKANLLGQVLAGQLGQDRAKEEIQGEIDKLNSELKALPRTKTWREQKALQEKLKAMPFTPPRSAIEREKLQAELKLLIKDRKENIKKRGEILKKRRQLTAERDGPYYLTFLDSVAAIHSLDWPVVDPNRLRNIRKHLLKTLELSKKMWRLVRQETDDDYEWITNANQTSSSKIMQVTDKKIDSWMAVVSVLEDLLEGKKLLAHPRFKKGINIRKIFETATRLDFIFFVTGHGALPYLEDGDIIDRNTWQKMPAPLGKDLQFFTLWSH